MNDSYKLFFCKNYLENQKNLFEKTKNINSKVDSYVIFYEIINLFFDLIRIISSFSKQEFPSNFARWVYLNDRFNFINFDELFLKKLQILKKKLKNKNEINVAFLNNIFLEILRYSIFILKQDSVNNKIDKLYDIDKKYSNSSKDLIQYDELKELKIDYNFDFKNTISIKGILKDKKIRKDKFGKINKKVLICTNEEYGKFYVILNPLFDYLFDNALINSTINFINLELFKVEDRVFIISEKSYIVYEPDYLFDITELSECFTSKELNPNIYFLKLLTTSKNSLALIKGTLVNSIFDELVINPNIDFETAFHKSIKLRPLRIIPLLNKENSEELKQELEFHYNSISSNQPSFPIGTQLIEPSFISNVFGLQGRLDLLIESNEDENRKEVIELKSGKSPNAPIKFGEGQNNIFLNSWTSHSAQANGYNLLLESVFLKRSGTSSIFYSSDIEKGIRNVPNIFELKNEIITVRNKILLSIQKILNGQLDVFNLIIMNNFKDTFLNIAKNHLIQKLKNLDKIERHYYNSAFKFILKEEITSKLGSNNGQSGQLYLWNSTEEDKLENYSILTKLEFDESSDFDLMHIILKFDSTLDNINFFRKGDQCLIYPEEKSDNPTEFYLIKGFIREINSNRILISLLNKSIDRNIFKKYRFWTLEIDRSDSLIKKQFDVLNRFFESKKEKRELLLGLKQPQFDESVDLNYDYLNEHQNYILNQAISAQDFLLIQGPPGTGKTSRIIRAISEYYFKSTETKVLLCAYTNRAVDEICDALDKIHLNFPFIRISGKELENYSERSIPFLSSKLTVSGLKKQISSTRFFVSTVSSLQTNPEIFDLVDFDNLILDEASQVLETQIIGIISRVKKFILIGDEKQLPAIVLHDPETDEILKRTINLENFSESLFQRLLKICKANNWEDAIASLTHQGRMHQQIQALSNFLVYENKLSAFDNEWQKKEISDWYNLTNNELKRFFEKRVIFINSPKTDSIKFNIWEVKQISEIIQKLYKLDKREFTDKTIGVISPFRLQCRAIINELPEEIKKLVVVDTVERFQGSERDIIVLSLATNYDYLLTNIMNEIEIDGKIIDRKLNVAITRAKEHLIIFGNEEILKRSEVYTKAVNWIKDQGKFIEVL